MPSSANSCSCIFLVAGFPRSCQRSLDIYSKIFTVGRRLVFVAISNLLII